MIAKRKKTVSRASAVAMLCSLTASLACASGISFELTNATDEPVHIWVDDFESMGPDNRLEPGETRHARDPDGDGLRQYTLSAGRNSQVLDSTVCSQEIAPHESPYDYVARFFEDDAPTLICNPDF